MFEGGLALGFALLHRAAFRSWHGLSYLWSGQFRTLASVAEALYWSSASAADAPTDLTPDEVAENADRYLAGFEARRKWVMRVALTGMNLYPLLFVHPTFTLMAVDERRHFLERHFSDDVARRRIGSLRRWLVQGMIRLAQQATYLGYYGDPAQLAGDRLYAVLAAARGAPARNASHAAHSWSRTVAGSRATSTPRS